MTLVDTSVWINFFRGDPSASALARLLDEGTVLMHPWVVGEFALGQLGRRRTLVLADLRRLPTAAVLPEQDVHTLVETRSLWGRGIGWVDAHLLGSALVTPTSLWTHDRHLADIAQSLGLDVTAG